MHPNNIFIESYERALTISVIECANRNKSFVDSFNAEHRARRVALFVVHFYPTVLESSVKVSERDSSRRERFSWRNVLSHVANIKLIWRYLNTARGKFVRGFANLVKFKYYVLITHKVLRPRTSTLASIKFVAVPATKSLSANAVKDDATNVDRIENLYKSLSYHTVAPRCL